MALNAAIVWEVRTTGSANNGGGFKTGATGTDYSQQDAAQDSGTDLACADGDAAAPVITSATHDFVATDVGNIINITEAGDGFTLGRYEIVSVNANAATLDRACGTNGAKTGGDWYLGGAAISPNTVAGVVVAGNTIWIKSGTYAELIDPPNLFMGYGDKEVRFKGYKTTRDDNPTGTDRPLIDGGSVRANCLLVDNYQFYFANLRFANATGDGVSAGAGNNYETFFINCKSSNNGGDGFDLSGFGIPKLINCESNNNAIGFYAGNGNGPASLYGCYVHDNTSYGIGYYEKWDCRDTISESNSGHGFYGQAYASSYYLNCIAYNNTGASIDGFNIKVLYNWKSIVVNNISISNGRYGFYNTNSSSLCYFDYNLYYGNGTAGLQDFTAGSHDLTSDPLFTAPTTGNFTLQAGSPCLDAGFAPGTDTGLIGTY